MNSVDRQIIDVPPPFICPISFEIMKDPVTISSGVTFERDSIHKWLFFYNHETCPVTKQTLPHKLLIPNFNLLRLIESWLKINHRSSLRSPRKRDINQLMEDMKQISTRMKCTRKIKLLIQENDCHRIWMVDAGVDKALALSLVAEVRNMHSESSFGRIECEGLEFIEEATSLLHCLKLPKEKLKILSQDHNGVLVSSLSVLLTKRMNSRVKVEVVFLLKSIFRVADDLYKTELKAKLFEGILEILKDQNSGMGSMAALSILLEILPRNQHNRRKAVEAGIVSVLIELLAESTERRECEQILLALEILCKVASGRAAVLAHPAGVAAVSSKILRISHAANDRAVGLILSLFRYCKIGMVAEELVEVGGAAKMCMVVQTDCHAHTKGGNPGKYLVAFTFDATVAGSVTIIFLAKVGEDCCLTPTKESLYPPITVHFQQGLAQKFKQPSGTGIDLSTFQEGELSRDGDTDVYPLAVKADASPGNPSGNPDSGSLNSHITQAVFEKDKGEYQVKVVKQMLWVNGMRYELQEIYGIGNSVEDEFQGNDPGKECVICLSEPRDTAVLPCRHMCMCSKCAKVLGLQTNRCPICRQPVERHLEIKVSKETDE